MSPLSSDSLKTSTTADQNLRAIAVTATGDRKASIRHGVIAFLVVAIIAVMTVTASAQQAKFETLKLPEGIDNPKTVKRMELAARNYAGTGSAEENVAKFYFDTYMPGILTQPDSVEKIGPLVKNVTTLLSRAQRSGNPRANRILGWVYQGMKKVAEGNYHPPARINAILVLGRLDEAAADQVTQTPPIPLRYSLPILIAQYENQQNVDGVRAAALQGLHRYVSYGLAKLSDADKAKIQAAMTDLLSADPPQGRPEVAHAFLQRYAVDMLDLLRADDDPALGTQLVSISGEPKNHDLIALHSAARLGQMSAEMQGKVAEPEKLINSWSRRVLNAFKSEVARLNSFEPMPKARQQPSRPEDFLSNKTARKVAGGPAGDNEGMDAMMQMMMAQGERGGSDTDAEEAALGQMEMMMMMGMNGQTAPSQPQPPVVVSSRRKLAHVLQQVHLGVTGSPTAGLPDKPGGVLAMAADDKKAAIESWVTSMEEIVTALNDEALDTEKKYLDALALQIEELESLLGTSDPEAEKANDADADELNRLLSGVGTGGGLVAQ